MLYRDFKKNPSPLYSIIFLNIMMCFFGFSVSFTRTDTQWARITLCILWGTMLIAATLNQGHVYICLLYTSPSPRDVEESRMPSSA